MKTLVIHPYDHTTDFLTESYQDFGYMVVRDSIRNQELKRLVREHDRIIMMGHGSDKGLFGHGKLVVDWELISHLRDKIVMAIWCNADQFCIRYKLKGIYTGMIISEMEEALQYCVVATPGEINTSNSMLSKALKKAIALDGNMVGAISTLRRMYQSDDIGVIKFNTDNIFINI